jgi:hypothetical protein
MKKITLLFIACLTLSFSSFSQTTAIPDTNFEQALIDAGFDSDGVINGQILTADAAAVTGELNLDDKNITDFTGVKAFTGIDVLSCKGNPNTTLDISGMTNINTFAVEVNPNLTAVNTSGCTGLQYLFATLCPLLNTINVSGNAALLRLYFYNTVVSSIDVSDCVVLDRFYCYSSSLATLDVSNNPVLTRLRANSNANLTSLDVRSGGNTVLADFRANDNSSLACINVDDVAYSTTNWTTIDTEVVFSTNCGTLSTESFESFKYSLYPNPIKGNNVTLKSESEGTYVIYNIIGKEVKKDALISGENVLNTSQLNAGIYIILINDTFGASKSIKIIKE